MKLSNKIAIVFSSVALVLNLVGVCATFARPQTTEETGVYFTPAERMGNVDETGTLFVTPDGNLFAVDAQYATSAEEFLLRMDTHGTPEKTDDEILEVWALPSTK